MKIEAILTPSGVKCLKYFMAKPDYHSASISEVKRNMEGCNLSIGGALKSLTEAKILNRERHGKMVLYIRNPNIKALNAFEAFINMVKEKDE